MVDELRIVIPVQPDLPSWKWTTGQHYLKAMPKAIQWNVKDAPPEGDVYFMIEGLVDLHNEKLKHVSPKAVYFIDSHLSMVTEDIWKRLGERYTRFGITRDMCNDSHSQVLSKLKPDLCFVGHKEWLDEYPNSHLLRFAGVLIDQPLPKVVDFIFIGHIGPYHKARLDILGKAATVCMKRGWSYIFGCSYEDPVRLMSAGRVVINISVAGDSNMRVYEAAGVSYQLIDSDACGNTDFTMFEGLTSIDIPASIEQVEERMELALRNSKGNYLIRTGYFQRANQVKELFGQLKKEHTMTNEIGPNDLLIKLPNKEARQKVVEFLQGMPGNPLRASGNVDVQRLFEEAVNTPSDINEHLCYLEQLARSVGECPFITELGVRSGVSTCAWVKALAKLGKGSLYCIDIDKNSIEHVTAKFEGSGVDLTAIHCDSLDILKDCLRGPREGMNILFIDTLHEGTQLFAELILWAPLVCEYIVLHDTETFGEVGELGGKGLKWALNAFLNCEIGSYWEVMDVRTNNNGLTTLRRKD